MGLFDKLKQGLAKTKQNFTERMDEVFSAFKSIDDDLYDELEEVLIMADVGGVTSVDIIENLREQVKKRSIKEADQLREVLKEIIMDIMPDPTPIAFKQGELVVILIIGVNGVGKTTTIGKLANKLQRDGKKVLLAAADTFRAAAIDQLEVWAQRSETELIKHSEGSDPAAVVYDAVIAAKARGYDVLIVDTAGRLHNKKNLMEELKKINRIIEREAPDAEREVFLVLDATTGQNALSQAKLFGETADITGIVLTKLDGSAKGGVVISIAHEQPIPVRYVGIGEQAHHLDEFSKEDFVNALFDESGDVQSED